MIRAEILSTGDELISGSLVDTNAAWIAERLLQTGLQVRRISCVGDEMQVLSSTLQEISHRADIAVLTGGLGPTPDDLTAQAAAQAGGRDLKQDEKALQSIEEFFARLNRSMPASNLKQALLPAGSLCLTNPVGTAPGFSLYINNCRFFALPGVPREMKQMFKHSVIPWIEENFAHDLQPLTLRVVSCFGITESQTSQAMQGFEHSFPSISMGFRFHFPVIQVRLYSRQQAGKVAEQDMEQAVAWVKQRLGDKVFSCQERSLEEETLQLLKAQDSTLAVLEGCSGGLLAHLTTRTEYGRQALLMARVVQEDLQAVSPELGSPADQVQELVQEIREGSGSDFGLATVFEKGTSQAKAWIGLADKQSSLVREFPLGYPGRQANITALAYAALNMLRLKLLGNMD